MTTAPPARSGADEPFRTVPPLDHRSAWVELLDLLRPWRQGQHAFRGAAPAVEWGVPFGGLLVAQGLAAASGSVPEGLWVRSLHAYYVQAGEGDQPVDIDVRPVRDGRSSAWRTVEVTQSEWLLLRMEVMFTRDTAGPTHQSSPPAVPGPDQHPNVGDQLAPYDDTFRPWGRTSPFDLRYVTPPPRLRAEASDPATSRLWVGRGGPDPGDRALAAALLAYASDLCMLDACLIPHGLWFGEGSASGFSLDHSIWFHAPARVPDWMLMEQTSPAMRDGRGLGQAHFYAADDELLMSVSQLGTIRPPRPVSGT